MADCIAYTAIFGPSKDKLYDVPRYEDQQDGCRCRYVCFTDRPQRVGTGWELRAPLWLHPTEPRRTARYHKLLSHRVLPHAEQTVWLDATLTPTVNLCSLARETLKESELVTWKHPHRVCTYQEAMTCVRWGKDQPAVVHAQMGRYLSAGFPYFHGLVESSVLVRRNTPAVQAFNEAWWHELQAGSVRDQLSFNYAAWKQKFSYGLFPIGLNMTNSPWFKHRSHW